MIEAVRQERRIRWHRVLIFGVLAPLATLAVAFCGLIFSITGPPHFVPITQTIESKTPVCGTWNATAWPNVSGGGLKSLAAIAKDDIWAVGSYGGVYGTLKPVIRHWDGKSWDAVSSPTQGKGEDWLEDVAAISANDVWAVGVGSSRTLIQHWDGTAWSIVPSPNAGTDRNALYGVAAVTSDDVWAVGSAKFNRDYQPLIMHWNGREWSIFPSPRLSSGDNQLNAITVVSADDIWAVGYTDDGALTMHWDGSSWKMMPSTNHNGIVPIGLNALSANSPDDIWAVGSYWRDAGAGAYTTDLGVIHWNGRLWSEFFIPRPENGSMVSLRGVAALAPDDVWTVGEYFRGGDRSAITAHWDGKSWSLVTSPTPLNENGFADVATIPQVGVWAVGSSDHHEDGPNYALAAHFGRC